MKKISRTEYEQLGGIHHQYASGFTTEKSWYVHNALLGIVLLDNIDKDWSFVALAPDPRRPRGMISRAFDVGTNFATPELAHAALERAFEAGPDPSFYTEKV